MTLCSLGKLCFTHIVTTLDEYTNEELTLLPKHFREQLLYSIPVADVCRLEGTQFALGIDMSSLWEHLYKRHISVDDDVVSCWKDNFFASLTQAIFVDRGYLETNTRNKLNSLVAVQCDVDKPVQGVRTIPELVQQPQQELVIPARYEKFCSQRHQYQLPDPTALELISGKCHYRPKQFNVSVESFALFLQKAKQERTSVNFLIEFFERVEELTIRHQQWQASRSTSDSNESYKDVPSEVLRLVLHSNTRTLSSLTIDTSRMFAHHWFKPHNITCSSEQNNILVDTIAPILSSSYSELKNFNFYAAGIVSPDLQQLTSATENQSQLQTISIVLKELGERIGCSRGPIIWHSPQVSMVDLKNWLQVCLKKPSLCHLKCCVTSISTDFFNEILAAFLSAPCSHEQTLHLDCEVCGPYSGTHAGNDTSDCKKKKASIPHHFEGSSTRLKSLVFDKCNHKVLARYLLLLENVQLKKLAIHRVSNSRNAIYPSFFSQLAQPNFNVEILEIAEVGMRKITFSDFHSLLEKRSLHTVKLIDCHYWN